MVDLGVVTMVLLTIMVAIGPVLLQPIFNTPKSSWLGPPCHSPGRRNTLSACVDVANTVLVRAPMPGVRP